MVNRTPKRREKTKPIPTRVFLRHAYDEMTAFCRGKIATYKIPAYWKFVDSYPMTVKGNIQKFRKREISIEELGLSDSANTETA